MGTDEVEWNVRALGQALYIGIETTCRIFGVSMDDLEKVAPRELPNGYERMHQGRHWVLRQPDKHVIAYYKITLNGVRVPISFRADGKGKKISVKCEGYKVYPTCSAKASNNLKEMIETLASYGETNR